MVGGREGGWREVGGIEGGRREGARMQGGRGREERTRYIIHPAAQRRHG